MKPTLILITIFILTLHTPSLQSLTLISPPQNDALAILAFKAKADPHNNLHYSINTTSTHCKWYGIQCQENGKVIRLVLENLTLKGSKSTRAKPLHWTSCLKIAEDIAQGLSYIHQAWRLVHGNLKLSNVLLGSDFEACLSDYCLSALVPHLPDTINPESNPYEPPETRKLNQQPTAKSDIYSFGVLLLELLTGKPAIDHPHLMPDDMVKWVKAMRDNGGGDSEDNRLIMLVEVAIICRVSSPEQRPTMWQVLKMIQEIKEAAANEEVNETSS